MELIDLIPEFNLYEEYWKIYTKCDTIEPQVHSTGGKSGALHYWGGSRDPWSGDQFGNRTECIYIGPGAVVRDSIIMKDTSIGRDVTIDKSIIAENCRIEDGVTLGIGGSTKQIKRECLFVWTGNDWRRFCCSENVKVGKNTAISGLTVKEDYPDGVLAGGEVIIKAGDRK